MKFKAILTAILLMSSAIVVNPASALDTNITVTGISKDNRYIIQGKNGSLKHVIQQFGNARRLFGDFAVAMANVDELRDSLQSSGQRFGAITISPDEYRTRVAVPDDTLWANLWGMATDSNYGIDLLAAHDLFTAKQPGADAVVAVLDTGYTDHPDLEASYEGGYDFLEEFDPYGDPQSNDGDGPDTDPHDAGDFWLENLYGGPWGSSWHGTHVHGTIAATKNNGVGVVGVAPSSDVIHGRVLGTWGGFDSAIAASIRWAAGLAVSGVPANTKPADVINLSLGGASPTCPSIYANAISAARTAGSVVVVAAGNSNEDAGGFTPANCTGAITVAATGPEGYRSWYSNYGSVVDIAAPGGDSNYTNGGIQSTLNTGFSTPQVPTYAYYQGTSMATPHVAGVVALIRSANPDLTVEQVETILLASVNSFRADARTNSCSQSGKCGAGLVDAQKAVAAAFAAGGGGGGVTDTQVQTASATVESGKATINWTAPRNVTNLSGYQVTVAGLRSSCTNTAAQLSCTFTRLKNGQSYTATIKAKYESSYAEGITVTFMPAGIPSSLSISSVSVGRGTLSVAWRAASPNGSAILGYRVEALLSNGSVAGFCETTTALTCTISGLSAGSYKVKLIATNAMGSASVTSRSTYRIR